MLISSLVLIFCSFASVQGGRKTRVKHPPSYITPCRISDPNLKECIVTSGKQAIPTLLRGDPAYKLRTFLPFHLERADITPHEKLSIVLTDIDIHGLDTLELLDGDFDPESKYFSVDLSFKLLTLLAKYNASGEILFLSLRGTGPCKLEFGNVFLRYKFGYDLVRWNDGKEYISNVKPNVDFKLGTSHYQLDNLFNGDKQLGDAINRVLNDNADEIAKEFEVVIKKIITLIGTKLVKAYFTSIPYNKLFLP